MNRFLARTLFAGALALSSTLGYAQFADLNGALSGKVDKANGLNQLQYVAPGTGAVSRTLSSKLGDVISVKDFGAKGDNVTDDTVAFQNWWTACMTPLPNSYGGVGGNNCFIPAGHYKLQSLVWDFAANPGGGAHIYGAGSNATTLDFSGTPGAYLYTHNSGNEGWYYTKFENFGVYAQNTTNAQKAAWQINPDPSISASDAANGITIDHVYVGNKGGAISGTKGLALNNVYNGTINAFVYNFGCTLTTSDVATCPDGGDALYLNAVAYSTIRGSASSTTNGIHITASTAGYTQMNTFINVALENLFTNILIDNQYVRDNTFIGGQYVWCTAATNCPNGTHGYGINATAGYSNIFINPNLTLSTDIVPPGACDNGVQLISAGGVVGTDTCTARWQMSNPNGNLQMALSGGTGYLTNNANGSIHLGVPTGNSVAMDVNGSNVANFGYWANGYQNAAPVTIGTLPACGSTSVGTMAWVSDGKASPAYHEVVNTGATGSAKLPVYCTTMDGSTFSWVY